MRAQLWSEPLSLPRRAAQLGHDARQLDGRAVFEPMLLQHTARLIMHITRDVCDVVDFTGRDLRPRKDRQGIVQFPSCDPFSKFDVPQVFTLTKSCGNISHDSGKSRHFAAIELR